jgi:ankyrin repeat protein
MLAAEKGDAITTALLIAAGANVNARHSGQIRYGPRVLRGKCLKPAFTSDIQRARRKGGTT